MPWITKPSGTMKIAHRDQAYLTPAIKDYLSREILPRYERKQGALLPTLHRVQEEWGWLPWQSLVEIAAFLGLKPSEVWDTASFYEEFWVGVKEAAGGIGGYPGAHATNTKGEHVIAVCRSISCEVCDHKKITDACRSKLGIEVGETTEDGKFTLIEIECLGLCEGAPAALIDHTAMLDATPQAIEKAIDEAGRGNGHHH